MYREFVDSTEGFDYWEYVNWIDSLEQMYQNAFDNANIELDKLSNPVPAEV